MIPNFEEENCHRDVKNTNYLQFVSNAIIYESGNDLNPSLLKIDSASVSFVQKYENTAA